MQPLCVQSVTPSLMLPELYLGLSSAPLSAPQQLELSVRSLYEERKSHTFCFPLVMLVDNPLTHGEFCSAMQILILTDLEALGPDKEIDTILTQPTLIQQQRLQHIEEGEVAREDLQV